MIINWGDAPFKAFITVTYPSGTCTCTNGTKTFTHTGGGTTTFTVNKKGNWTVTATDGTHTPQETVSITASNQSKTVTLAYRLYLYNMGDLCTSVTGGWTTDDRAMSSSHSTAKPTISNSSSGMSITANPGGSVRTSKAINFSKYSKLVFEGTLCTTSGYLHYARLCAWTAVDGTLWDNSYKVASKQATAANKDEVLTISASSLNSSYYVGIGYFISNSVMKKLYLEV